MRKRIAVFFVLLFLFPAAPSATAQRKETALSWLRDHLKTVVVRSGDPVLKYTMTKTYTFYGDAFVVKTVKDFYEDSSLNMPPAYGKVWYRDIFIENDTAIARGLQREQTEGKAYVYTIWAKQVYSIIGREDAPLSFWRTFDEPTGLDLYLPGDSALSMELIKRFMLLATACKTERKRD